MLLAEKEGREEPVRSLDRRRSPRILLTIPVVVQWTDVQGEVFEEPSTTKLVNAYGALLSLKRNVPMGTEITLSNVITGATTRARVIWYGGRSRNNENEVGIELADASPDFWEVRG